MSPAVRPNRQASALLAALVLGGVHALAPAAPGVPYSEAIVPAATLRTPESRLARPKVSDDLAAVVDALVANDAPRRLTMAKWDRHTRPNPLFQLSGERADRIEVYVQMEEWTEASRRAVESAGARIRCADPGRHLYQAWVPLDRLSAVADLECVREVRRPNYAIPTGGLVDSEGDAYQGTYLVRQIEHVLGDGVTVGVFSNGLFDDNNQLNALDGSSDRRLVRKNPGVDDSTDIPATYVGDELVVTSQHLGDVQVSPGSLDEHQVAGSGDIAEGGALIEIIHDVAPNARIIYGNGSTDALLASARANFTLPGLVPDVIADNLTFVGVGRYDGTSAVSRGAVELARTRNIAYFVTSGAQTPPNDSGPTAVNGFPLFINGYFNPDPRPGRAKSHSWAPRGGSFRDEAIDIDAQFTAGDFYEMIEVTLVWDDYWDDNRPRATDDLDLFLVDRDTLDVEHPLAFSIRTQNGNGSNPVESLVYLRQVTTPTSLVLRRKDQTNNSQTPFTLTISQGIVLESQYLTHGIPLNNADALAPVVTVGDIDSEVSASAIDPQIVPGLTTGPRFSGENSFFRWYETQTSPTVLGFGNVSTLTTTDSATFGLGLTTRFVGPSSAVPHVAGFAALLRQRFPFLPTWRFASLFTDTSGLSDTGTPILPNAVEIAVDSLEGVVRAPSYIRVEPYNLYRNMISGATSPTGSSSESARAYMTPVSTLRATEWVQGPPESASPYARPSFEITDQGLALTPGAKGSYGFWESPLVAFPVENSATDTRSTLRRDRLYVAEVRVGSTERDPLRVPDFRLRLTSATGEEVASLVVAGLTVDASNVPTTVSGKTYRLYYQPSNDAIARQGMRLAFEVLSFTDSDNPDATLILQDVVFHEMIAPALPAR